MAMKKALKRGLAAAVIGVTALGGIGAVPTPAAGYPYLAPNTLSPQYMVNGCKYKVIYFGYGSTPVGGVRQYGGCNADNFVGVWSADANGEDWNYDGTVAGSGTDGCGAYTYMQAVGPNPAYAIGVSYMANDEWMHYSYQGADTQPVHSTC